MRVRPLVTGVAIVLGACGTAWTVDKFEAPEAGFAHRRTYAWKDSEFGLPAEVDPAVLERADKALRSTIDAELASKGYVPAGSADSADMLVSYQVVGQRRFVIADDRPVGASAATEAMKPGAVPGPPPSSSAAAGTDGARRHSDRVHRRPVEQAADLARARQRRSAGSHDGRRDTPGHRDRAADRAGNPGAHRLTLKIGSEPIFR